jgi:prevent-host-death family protein
LRWNAERSLRSLLEADQFMDYFFAGERACGRSGAEQSTRVTVTYAKGQLTELVRRGGAGDEVILTRHGHAAVRLVPVKATPDRRFRRALLDM